MDSSTKWHKLELMVKLLSGLETGSVLDIFISSGEACIPSPFLLSEGSLKSSSLSYSFHFCLLWDTFDAVDSYAHIIVYADNIIL